MAPRKTKEVVRLPLYDALSFVKHAQRDDGTVYQTHCRIYGKNIVAYDGILACGIRLPDDDIDYPYVCPNTYKLLHAIERVKDVSSVSFDNASVTIRTAKFTANVPTVPPENLVDVGPDAPSWPLNNDFRAALIKAAVFTREGAQTVLEASVYCTSGSCIGTNGLVIIEAWHGLGFPDIILPKVFVDALGKIKKDISCFGVSDTSLTVWFDDNSWIRTQLYSEEWPVRSLRGILDEVSALPCDDDTPADFWDGIKTVLPFTPDGRAMLDNGEIITSGGDGNVSSSYKVKGLDAPGVIINCKQVNVLSEHNPRFNFTGNDRLIAYIGNGVRGAISKIRR